MAFKAAGTTGKLAERLPISLKIVLENVLRQGDWQAARAVIDWALERHSTAEVPFRPARILMQDFTGVPAIVDLAAMRDGMKALGGDPDQVNPLVPIDLVIDHSVAVDVAGRPDALAQNVTREFARNAERYGFLRWGAEAFGNFKVVPPGNGICHQVNLEHLAPLVVERDGQLFPDTVFGTDSHTTMINGLGVLGWGVGGIEAEAAALGEAIAMRVPDVVGVRLEGALPAGTTATDLVLHLTQMLRKVGVVGRFVEFFGPALDQLPLADRATIANMAPEYGATCGYFPPDSHTVAYLRQTGRPEDHIKRTENYLRAQGMWRDPNQEPVFTQVVKLDLGQVRPTAAGPKNPSDRHDLAAVPASLESCLAGFGVAAADLIKARQATQANPAKVLPGQGDIVLAAITSCTNTSNPSVMVAAGLLARNARAKGLKPKPWVKTSLAPGSRAVTNYLKRAGLDTDLDALGFETVGYGCTSCIGNSGPLAPAIAAHIENANLVVAGVLSGNRNFEGRVSPWTKANYIMSPPLVVAYALAGHMGLDLTTQPLGKSSDGEGVFLRDIWPTMEEVQAVVAATVTPEAFAEGYAHVEEGPAQWQALKPAAPSATYDWPQGSTYIHNPPWLANAATPPGTPHKLEGRILAMFGDNITTDHISPAGAIAAHSPAARWLERHGVAPGDFNSYGARRGNDQVMARGTFANIRLRNELVLGVEGGQTRHWPSGEQGSIFDVAERYQREGTPTVIVAGRQYGMGSSRDWAAKGTRMLGVRAVIAEDFERIHRANLVGMAVIPLTFPEEVTRQTLGLKGDESVTLTFPEILAPGCVAEAIFTSPQGKVVKTPLSVCVETNAEAAYLAQDGILPFVLRRMAGRG
nr:aconitate hydratase AcnA [Formicincola oecophyllae]